jgi:hypothetical protein
MADPTITSLVKDTWTKVATAIYGGTFYPWLFQLDATTKEMPEYAITYIDTGTTTLDAAKNAVAIPLTSEGALIKMSYQVDVYIISRNAAGEVWVGI